MALPALPRRKKTELEIKIEEHKRKLEELNRKTDQLIEKQRESWTQLSLDVERTIDKSRRKFFEIREKICTIQKKDLKEGCTDVDLQIIYSKLHKASIRYTEGPIICHDTTLVEYF